MRNALIAARKAWVSAKYAIKGREHTGFISEAITSIDVALAPQQTSKVASQGVPLDVTRGDNVNVGLGSYVGLASGPLDTDKQV